MDWARIQGTDGQILTGVISDGVFLPRKELGSDEGAGDPVPLDQERLLAPTVPGKFIGLWNNYHAAAARNKLDIPEHPLWFLKPVTSLAGPDATVQIPADVDRVIFEGELGIVIGQECRHISEDEADTAILGYTCINDITALQVLTADPSFPQWTRAKGFDGFGVVGPVIATDLNWRELTIRVEVNGRERQSYPAEDMIMPPAKIVSKLSEDVTLMPGDVIACGTSIGARPVKAGDRVEVIIDGIGRLGVTMADDTSG